MTFLEVRYRLEAPLLPAQAKALGELAGQYGIQAVSVDEGSMTARIRYDASRLNETEMIRRVRMAGVAVGERLHVEMVSW